MNKEPVKFQLTFIPPFSTFQEGEPTRIPFIVDGLLTEGGFSALGAKPKQGKSSLSRYLAVCIAKGVPFLGRDTVKGDVILISLEDPLNHVDNCLKMLGYDDSTDSRIHIVTALPSTIAESISVLEEHLDKMPEVRLIIIDTLAKFIRVKDLNDYMVTLLAVEQLHNLARKFPHLHVLGVAHCKKLKTDDPFDSLLGSTALRGEPDTNIAIFQEGSERGIVSETRMGRHIPQTLLRAEIIESAGCDVVKDFSLGAGLDELRKQKKEKADKKQNVTYEDRIIEYLLKCEKHTATQQEMLENVEGRDERLLEALEKLKSTDPAVLTVTGKKQSPTNPLRLTLHEDRLSLYRFMDGQFGMHPSFDEAISSNAADCEFLLNRIRG